MNVLLLTLTLGLTCIAQDLDKELESELNTEILEPWNTIYLTANNEKKISENGPLRLYFRNINQHNYKNLTITFYVRVNSTCQKFSITSTKIQDVWYSMYYSGKIYLQLLDLYEDINIIYIVNISKDGDVTSVMLALASGHDLSPKYYEYFKIKTKEMRVPLENIIKISDTDTCPHNSN